MAIDQNGLRFLLLAQADGVSFARTTTLGRLTVYLDEATLMKTFEDFGHSLAGPEAKRILHSTGGFADVLFRRLGCEAVESLDASDYQSATITFDLNEPLPDSLRRSCTAVLDFGTLEHIFNAPRALANCMEMVELDGHLLVCAPADSWFGHGFYQFGPEFYFRALSAENGFRIQRVLLCTSERDAAWYALDDPAKVGRRAEAPPHTGPVTILVLASRVNERAALAAMPQQSDYEATWRAQAGISNRFVRRHVPPAVKKAIKARLASPPAASSGVVEVSPESLAGRRAS
jgi:hypothetical protein